MRIILLIITNLKESITKPGVILLLIAFLYLNVFGSQRYLPIKIPQFIWLLPFIITAAVGILKFFIGLILLRDRRHIQDMPISKIGSIALGLCKIRGKALPQTLIESPLSGRKCLFYKCLSYYLDGYGARRNVHEEISKETPIFIADDTGYITILPEESESYLGSPFKSSAASGKRFEEWIILPGDQLIVLGTCIKSNTKIDPSLISKFKLVSKLQKLKGSAGNKNELDTNKDGIISSEEWDNGVEILKNSINREEELNERVETFGSLSIAKGAEREDILVISNNNEEQFFRALKSKALRSIIIGCIIGVVSIWLIFIIKGPLLSNVQNRKASPPSKQTN